MKKPVKFATKLVLDRATVRALAAETLDQAAGAMPPPSQYWSCMAYCVTKLC